MLVHDDRSIDADVLQSRTGWTIRPEGACKGDTCIPLPDNELTAAALSDKLGMAIAKDQAHGVTALGPPSIAGRALDSVRVSPDLEFEDFDGNTVRLSDVRGSRTVLVSWAPW